jgi:hypothetical protein
MLLMVQIDIFLLKKKTTSQYVNPVRYIAEQVWPQRVDSQAVLLFRFDDASQRWWHGGGVSDSLPAGQRSNQSQCLCGSFLVYRITNPEGHA